MCFNQSLIMGGMFDATSGEDGITSIVELIVPDDTSNQSEQFDDSALEGVSVLGTSNVVLFPNVIVPITLKSLEIVQAVTAIHDQNGILGVVAEKSKITSKSKELYRVGTLAKIVKVIHFPNGKTVALAYGKQKFKILKLLEQGPLSKADVQLLKEPALGQGKKAMALVQALKDVSFKILKYRPDVSSEIHAVINNIKTLDFLTCFLASSINAELDYKQKLLEASHGLKRGKLLLEYLLKELELSALKKEIQDKVHSDISQQQRDYYLRQQVKVLQNELGEGDNSDEIDLLREKAYKKNLPKEVLDYLLKELDKAERMSAHSQDYAIYLNHAELIINLPWGVYTKDILDVERAKKVLDHDHYGIEKVKERLLEFIAILQLKKSVKGPILCLCGPPGVGKTSLGESIARAMGRKYIRIALGGLNDEAEIRGHRKTYVGAMPGKIIYNIQRVGSSNPVIVLDEIDKLAGMRGDPAAALLEVLDPEQNHTFVDHFLEVPYDLSKVLFIATANAADHIPAALQDRMEMVDVSGYILEEKVEIAKRHLFPKQRKEHGLKYSDLSIQDDAFATIIEGYTRESGVRELSRQIAHVCRKAARAISSNETYVKKVKTIDVADIIGTPIFDNESYQKTNIPGVSIGLAWTASGGEILFIESVLSRGKGRINLSGHLGDVMKESAMTALSFLRANDQYLDVEAGVFENYDLHIHVPSGAVPKDGPSAGITLFTSLVSLYTQKKVKDRLAMTGEITLRGQVLPVGGIKEKILAAKRVGIHEIILSHKNKRDVQDIKEIYRKDLIFHYVDRVDEVYNLALQKEKVSNAKIWDGSLKSPNADA